jgi:hypothetical protein
MHAQAPWASRRNRVESNQAIGETTPPKISIEKRNSLFSDGNESIIVHPPNKMETPADTRHGRGHGERCSKN